MKHEGFATAFERLDREILALKKLVLLSEMFSWNYSAKLSAVRLEPVREPGRTRFWAHAPIEWLVAGLALTVALCSCGEPERDQSIPEIAGPCPGPNLPERRPDPIIGRARLSDGSTLLIIEPNLERLALEWDARHGRK